MRREQPDDYDDFEYHDDERDMCERCGELTTSPMECSMCGAPICDRCYVCGDDLYPELCPECDERLSSRVAQPQPPEVLDDPIEKQEPLRDMGGRMLTADDYRSRK